MGCELVSITIQLKLIKKRIKQINKNKLTFKPLYYK